MKILHDAAELCTNESKVCLAIGMFDGVHLGHQQVIRQTISDARQHEAHSVVVTFDRHPASVIAPDHTPPLIYSLDQKLDTIGQQWVDATLLLEFNEDFSRISAGDFIRNLHRNFGSIHSICVGSRFTFGYKRSGNVEVLEQLGGELGFIVHGLASVSLDGEIVSSTRIRNVIRNNNFDAAGQMLGRDYCLRGKVIEGEKKGRKLGFPTANLDTTGLVLPGNGVYAAHVKISGQEFRAVLNIGLRPTVTTSPALPVVEVHVLGFDNDLYGKTLEVNFVDMIRDERKFDSLDALKKQIRLDIESSEKLFE